MGRSTYLVFFLIFHSLFISCSEEKGELERPQITDIPSFTASKIFSISETDSIYFSHLGYESVVLENGNIVIPDRQLANLVEIDEEGNLVKIIREGRGPGEIQDAYQFTVVNSGNIYTYDQGNDKIIVFDQDLNVVEEIIPPTYGSSSVHKVYATSNESELLFNLSSFEYFRNEDKERENILIKYDRNSESYGDKMTLKTHPYARLYIDGQVRGGTQVPYSYGNIFTYNSENQTLFIFNTASDRIAEINADFDTLSTIPVNLPTEEISPAERDSMEARYDSDQWKTVKERLPQMKAPVNKMKYSNGEFWLESNILGETEMWLVLNLEGQITRVVHLPKDSMLLHVSDNHLGVRLDDVTFAVFTNPKPESL